MTAPFTSFPIPTVPTIISTGSVTPRSLADRFADRLNAKDFGAVGDGVADDTAALQAAINAAIVGKKLFIPFGNYIISSPLLILIPSAGQPSCEIEGEKKGFSQLAAQGTGLTGFSTTTTIKATFNNTFAIGLQGGLGCKISNLTIFGTNDYAAAWAANQGIVMNIANLKVGGPRDSRYSPYAGLCIDPFSPSVPADGGYPGLTSYYGSVQYCSTCQFENLHIQGFVCGIALSPHGQSGNTSELTFIDCTLIFNTRNFCSEGTQSDNLNWYAGTCGGGYVDFDGQTYGQQEGNCPNIYGGNIGGSKYLLNVYAAAGHTPIICGIHMESQASLGFIGGGTGPQVAGPAFYSCELNFIALNGQAPDHHLLTYSLTKFVGCSLVVFPSQNAPPIPGNCTAYPFRLGYRGGYTDVTFDSCQLDLTWFSWPSAIDEFALAPTGFGVLGNAIDLFDQVKFISSKVGTGPRGNPDGICILSQNNMGNSVAQNFDKQSVIPGETFGFNQPLNQLNLLRTQGDLSFFNVQIGGGPIAVTVGANATATFTAPDPTIVRVGDLVYDYDSLNILESPFGGTMATSSFCMGIVLTVVGSTVTLAGVPQSLINGNYTLYIHWWQRIHQSSTCTTNGTTTLSAVTNIGTWLAGHRIQSPGNLPSGCYVTAVGASTLTISKAALSSTTGVKIYDALVYAITGAQY
jgi:hypothetical protein